MALVHAADDIGLPLLGICRGMQIMAVAAGGSLIQHVPDVVGSDEHSPGPDVYGAVEVEIKPGTRLAGILGQRVAVACHHHQAVAEHPGFDSVASADDGLLEAIETPGERFRLAVQWHPETQTDRRLFAALAAAASDGVASRSAPAQPPASCQPADDRFARQPARAARVECPGVSALCQAGTRAHAIRHRPRPDRPVDAAWSTPLADWPKEKLVSLPRGISRHVVRFVRIGGIVYAIKEISQGLAEHEYELLRELAKLSIPVVQAVGVVANRLTPEGEPLDAALVTKHLRFSLPYRALFSRRMDPDLENKLLDALAELLVKLHLLGFAWKDCSLSNTLFRRDAGALAAYLVDAETGELRESLSNGQRAQDLEIVETNVAGELLDLQMSGCCPSRSTRWRPHCR